MRKNHELRQMNLKNSTPNNVTTNLLDFITGVIVIYYYYVVSNYRNYVLNKQFEK